MDSFLHTSERQGVQKFVFFFKDLTSCLVKLENHTSNSCCWHNIYVACLQHELKLSLSFNHNTRRNDIIGKLHEFGSQSVAVNALVEPSTFLIGWHFVVVSPVLGPSSAPTFYCYLIHWYSMPPYVFVLVYSMAGVQASPKKSSIYIGIISSGGCFSRGDC